MMALNTRAGLFWLVPTLFAAHNLEEGLMMKRYLPAGLLESQIHLEISTFFLTNFTAFQSSSTFENLCPGS